MRKATPHAKAAAGVNETVRGAAHDVFEHHPRTGGWHPVEWACEFGGTAFQLFFTFCFVAFMESPLSPAHQAVGSSTVRLVLIGLFIGILAAVVAVSPLGRRSGAHLNPSVTVGFWARGSTTFGDLVGFVIAQLAGATLAALVFVPVMGEWAHTAGDARTEPRPDVSLFTVGLIEVAITACLVLTILLMVSAPRTARWTPVASTIALAVLIPLGGPPTGASMNPARTLGPDLASGTYTALGVYFIAPVLGALLAAGLFPLLASGRRVLTAKLYHDSRYINIHASYSPRG